MTCWLSGRRWSDVPLLLHPASGRAGDLPWPAGEHRKLRHQGGGPRHRPRLGYLEYREPLDDEAARRYELKPAELKKFLVEVTSVHTLEVEAENEDEAIEMACRMAWEYDADEIDGKILEGDDLNA